MIIIYKLLKLKNTLIIVLNVSLLTLRTRITVNVNGVNTHIAKLHKTFSNLH